MLMLYNYHHQQKKICGKDSGLYIYGKVRIDVVSDTL